MQLHPRGGLSYITDRVLIKNLEKNPYEAIQAHFVDVAGDFF